MPRQRPRAHAHHLAHELDRARRPVPHAIEHPTPSPWRTFPARARVIKKLTMRILHTMLRVNDLAESKRFYCDVLGMKVLREKEYPDGKFTLCFVGYGDEATSAVLELTHNWDTSSYTLGNAFGHVAL